MGSGRIRVDPWAKLDASTRHWDSFNCETLWVNSLHNQTKDPTCSFYTCGCSSLRNGWRKIASIIPLSNHWCPRVQQFKICLRANVSDFMLHFVVLTENITEVSEYYLVWQFSAIFLIRYLGKTQCLIQWILTSFGISE